MADAPRQMPPKAQAAYEIYRDLGPKRTLKDAAKLLGKSQSVLREWSAKHGWVALAAEHDQADLKEALGKRELVRERATQRLVDMMDDAVTILYDVMMDDRKLPVLDRQGEQLADEDGNKLFRPLVKASTKVMCAEKILGIGGLVPVKRTEVVDRTGEQLDAAANVIAAMSPAQVARFIEIMDEDDASD
jgi:hypothetical protein